MNRYNATIDILERKGIRRKRGMEIARRFNTARDRSAGWMLRMHSIELFFNLNAEFFPYVVIFITKLKRHFIANSGIPMHLIVKNSLSQFCYNKITTMHKWRGLGLSSFLLSS